MKPRALTWCKLWNMKDQIWFQSYQKGVLHEIDPHIYSSLADLLDQAFGEIENLPSFYNMGKSLTYGELDRLSQDFASYLQNELKLKRGDRIAIMCPNVLQYPIALFGAIRAGLAVVSCNPLYTARELEFQLKDSGAQTIVVLANFAHVLEKALPRTDVKNIILTQLGDMLPMPKSALINFVVRYVKKMVPSFSLPSAVPFMTALSAGRAKPYVKTTLSHEDFAFIQYTGGTTGISKGAVLSHGNMVANVLQAKAWIQFFLLDEKETVITALPLYHIFALTANTFVFSAIGARNILITNPRDFKGFVKELSKWKFTAITGVNTLFNALMNEPEFSKLDFSELKIALGGGMAVQRSVAEKWKKTTGVPLIEAYGLTETAPAACINPMDQKEYNGFVGLPISSTEVVILDDDGKQQELGKAGEVCIRGPQVMKGYWNRPEETANVMTKDGFFRTGDIGFMDEKGFVKLVDRKKDMILVSGFNVYPNEIEDVLAAHPGILEVAAIAVADERTGEAPKVFIVKRDAALTEKSVIDFARENLTGYKVPKHVEFRTELPKSPVGKILRKELKEKPKT